LHGKYTRALSFEGFFFCHLMPIWPVLAAASDVRYHVAVACLQPRCTYLYKHIYMFIYTDINIYIYMFIYTYINTYLYKHIYSFIHIYMCIYRCSCIQRRICVYTRCVRVYTPHTHNTHFSCFQPLFTRRYTHTHTHTHKHTHTHTTPPHTHPNTHLTHHTRTTLQL